MTNWFRNIGNILTGSAPRMTVVVVTLLAACAPVSERAQGPVFYPGAPEIPRLQYLKTISAAQDIGAEDSEFRRFLLGTEKKSEVFSRAFAIGHEKGKIYVVDPRARLVIIVNLAERKFDVIRDPKGGPFDSPIGLFVTKDGYKYIADRERGQILVFNERNEFFRAYGKKGDFRPLDVAVFGDRVYVANVRGHEVVVLDRESGDIISRIGGPGWEEGLFNSPTHIALDAAGNVYVTDFLNFRVQVFDQRGNFVKSIGEIGSFPGAMPRPKGLAVDRDEHLYVVDAAFENVQIFDIKTREILMAFAKFDETPAGSWLPAGIHVDYDNLEYFSDLIDKRLKAKYLVYVANQAGPSKVNVYAFGDWTGPPPEPTKAPSKAKKPPAKEAVPSLKDIPAPAGAKPPAKGGG